jgi:hypothetical protein
MNFFAVEEQPHFPIYLGTFSNTINLSWYISCTNIVMNCLVKYFLMRLAALWLKRHAFLLPPTLGKKKRCLLNPISDRKCLMSLICSTIDRLQDNKTKLSLVCGQI